MEKDLIGYLVKWFLIVFVVGITIWLVYDWITGKETSIWGQKALGTLAFMLFLILICTLIFIPAIILREKYPKSKRAQKIADSLEKIVKFITNR